LVLTREQQARLELEQRGDEHDELGGALEVELAGGLEMVEIGEHDIGELQLEEVDLLAQHECQQQVEGAGEDVEIEVEGGDAHGAQGSALTRRGGPTPMW